MAYSIAKTVINIVLKTESDNELQHLINQMTDFYVTMIQDTLRMKNAIELSKKMQFMKL
ncbi:16163_t:CDS:2 [Funneliformis mosseae]|uniref:16163_t:CDS:1 n=1 Tax=Funneliformis mosseae TaxID=27381 RepID=A0A9N9D1R5_FUNMO|nr:16163_t:CDS:2 [Funneliformis mosseae]